MYKEFNHFKLCLLYGVRACCAKEVVVSDLFSSLLSFVDKMLQATRSCLQRENH